LQEKGYSTTLIYKRCLSFNPQPQNQIFNTHEQSKPSDLHPSAVFKVVFTYVAATSARIAVTTSLGPTCHGDGDLLLLRHNI
jgi:hypothetical protein